MKAWLLLALCLASFTAEAVERVEDLEPLRPGSFSGHRELRARYKFGWAAFSAAEADFDLSKTKQGLLRLGLKTKTTGFVRTLWRLDAEHTSLVRADSFRPLRVEQKENYKDKRHTTRLAFDDDGVIRTRETEPKDPSSKSKPKRFKAPGIFDLHGALHLFRSQPLKIGQDYKAIVYATTSPYLAQVNVLGKDRIEAAGRHWEAVKMDLKLWRIDDDDLELKPYTKFKRATAWLSDDRDRLLLKVQAEIFVGSVWTELEKVEFKK